MSARTPRHISDRTARAASVRVRHPDQFKLHAVRVMAVLTWRVWSRRGDGLKAFGTPALTLLSKGIEATIRQPALPVKEFPIEVSGYQDYYQAAAHDANYTIYYPLNNLPVKSLEHFIDGTLLQLPPDDTYVDVASEHSPVPEIYRQLLGVELHCSFEHLEGGADSRFIRELGRVLRPGGATCCVPLYIADRYAIVTDPKVSARAEVEFEPGATLYGA